MIAVSLCLAVAAIAALAAVYFTAGSAQIFAVIFCVALSCALAVGYHWFRNSQHQLTRLSQDHAALLALNLALKLELDDISDEREQLKGHADLEQQRIDAVLRETSHRIGNTLASVSSLLALQSLRSQSNDVREALEVAQHRVHAIASSHRRVRSVQDTEIITTSEFLPAVIDDLASNLAALDKIRVASHVEAIPMTTRYVTTLGILVGELVSNAIKHAFADKADGQIVVRLERLDGIPVLSVTDDGVGLPSAGAASESGLGLVLVKQSAGQFGGVPAFEYPSTGGTRVIVSLPRLEAAPSDQSV